MLLAQIGSESRAESNPLKTVKSQIFGNGMCIPEKAIVLNDKLYLVEEFQIPFEYINNWNAPKFTESSQWNHDLVQTSTHGGTILKPSLFYFLMGSTTMLVH